jgi:transcriptional regulator with XRE-family HTH domain
MGRPSKAPRTPFGQRLHAARQAAGLSQAEIAARLGVKQAAYAAWERRRVALYPDQIQKLAHALKIPVKDLFERTPRSFMKCGPTGRARRALEALSELSRHRQSSALYFLEAFLRRHHPHFKTVILDRDAIAPKPSEPDSTNAGPPAPALVHLKE